MATKIRLQRGGRKSYAFYRIALTQEHHVMVNLLRRLVLTTLTPILPQ